MTDTTERKAKQTARETTEHVEAAANKAVEGLREYQNTILAVTQANMKAMFDYMQEVFSAKSAPELMEISTRHAQRQIQMMTEQAREIAGAIQKATAESTRSFTGLTERFRRMS